MTLDEFLYLSCRNQRNTYQNLPWNAQIFRFSSVFNKSSPVVGTSMGLLYTERGNRQFGILLMAPIGQNVKKYRLSTRSSLAADFAGQPL